MTTLDDRLLGEKTHYYCSSEDEDERERGKDDDEDEGATAAAAPEVPEPPPPPSNAWRGMTTNTGPKGVIKDWQRFKQLETEKREEQEAEKLKLIQKLSLNCASESEKEKQKTEKEKKKRGWGRSKKKPVDEDEDIDKILEEEDGFFDFYVKQRMQEMISRYECLPVFGEVLELKSGPEFLRAVDDEHKDVTVFVHLYDPGKRACAVLNNCLKGLTSNYSRGFKFCTLDVRVVNMTEIFQAQGVPALLIYRGGNLVGNFVRLGDEFKSDHFSAADVMKFLIEHGHLPDQSLTPKIIKSSLKKAGSDSD
ncbi:unnamed protein product [Notodromas monacha]|uniref:Phosducin domain-containing protein n=1 Tax=Notodromas monacha TaxID=399045 RepID=A0A7R9BEX7_9CRUS|nr:unnamed protein product [Notodromas monacha]CAG0914127.1 unnamed protein product [Notodromas monacha]